MKTKGFIRAVILAMALMMLFTTSVLAAPSTDNYQEVPGTVYYNGTELSGSGPLSKNDSGENESITDYINGNEYMDGASFRTAIGDNADVYSAWNGYGITAGTSISLFEIKAAGAIPDSIKNGTFIAYIVKDSYDTATNKAFFTKAATSKKAAIDGQTIKLELETPMTWETDASQYVIVLVKGGSSPTPPDPVKPVVISKDYYEYPVASIDVNVDEPLPAGITTANITPRELGRWSNMIKRYISTNDTLDSIDWPDGFERDKLLSLSALTAVGIEINYNKDAAADGDITFHVKIDGFKGTFAGTPYVFIVDPGTGPDYRLAAFPTQYDAETKTLTFTVAGYQKYFSYAIPIIGDVKLKTPPAPEPTGSSSSGCNAAPWNLLISLCAAFLCFKKYKG